MMMFVSASRQKVRIHEDTHTYDELRFFSVIMTSPSLLVSFVPLASWYLSRTSRLDTHTARMPLNTRTTRHQEKASAPKWKLQSTYMPGECQYVLLRSTPKICRVLNKASPVINQTDATNTRELQPESAKSLAGRRDKTAPPRILSTKNKTADFKHTAVPKVEG